MKQTWNGTRYVVRLRKTGAVAAEGTSADCARRLGMTYGSFLTIASRSRRGISPYQIERLERSQWQEEAARRWNRMFGWYRAGTAAYPCAGCVHRSLCSYSDQYCARFARWFRQSYDEAAGRLRRAAAKPE